jgi:hypothetical protein
MSGSTLLDRGGPTPSQVVPASRPGDRAEEAGALAAARLNGKPVEVMGLRSETAQVFAGPDGKLQAVLSARPVRVRKSDGSWAAVDTTLRRLPDGAVRAVASPLNARLSGGGSGPMVSIVRDGGELSLGWPDALPPPVLEGDTATYPDVLPGVDLRVRLAVDGFSKVLVVKSRSAAKQPALRTLRFTVAAKGFGVRVTASGGLTVTDPSGATVFGESGAPMMWDSSAVPRATAMPMSLSAGVLSVTPDQAFLSDPAATYPMFVDPSMSFGNAWTMINERHPGQSYWAYDRGEHAKVGYVAQPGDGWERYRSIFSFSLASLRGKHIKQAWMSSYLTHSYDCADSWTDMYLVGMFSSETNWGNHAGSWNTYLAGALNSDCRDTGRYSEWGNAAVTSVVAGAVAGGNVTLGLRAADEGLINRGWKKFDENRTALTVVYNSYPNTPDQLSVEHKPCASGEGRPYIGTTTPVLRARLTDPDSDVLNSVFRWAQLGYGGTFSKPWSEDYQGGVPSGGISQITTTPLRSGFVYGFHVQIGDGELSSQPTGWCEFGVDTTRPAALPVINSADGLYLNDGATHGGVGVSGSFAFGAAGITDVVGYRYGLASPPVAYVAANGLGGGAVAALTPDRRGTNKVYVQSIDRAGNPSGIAEYVFRAGSARPPVAAWTLDEQSGTALADSTGNGHPATLAGGTLGRPGRVVGGTTGVGFNGSSNNYASAGAGLVPVNASFSVAAWVRLTDTAESRTAVAVDGSRASGFYLKYSKTDNAWSFDLAASDTDGATLTRVSATTPARSGTWTHLVGTYDAATRQAILYVNGREARALTVPPTWNPTGPLTIGRARWDGKPDDFWVGDIADVRMWDRRIYPTEIAEIADAITTAGDWRFEEPSGPAADSSGFGRPMTLGRLGTSRTPGHRDTGLGLACSGTVAGYASTAGRVVNTDQSFAVSAWVRINNLNHWQTAVSADGTAASAFYLQYAKDQNRWAMSIAPTDVGVPSSVRALSAAAPRVSVWTHLVGVYDAGSHQARLYVNGQLEGTVIVPQTWRADGVLNVCRARHDSVPADFFSGAVDDVRVIAGVPTDLDVVSLYNQ